MSIRKNNDRNSTPMEWWREARFGMFIHWGLYSIPAGIWKDKEIPSIGEWIMRNAKIPIAEYEKLSGDFNPVKFDADKWVEIARRTGMRYLTVTAKHHDGFCMFHSPSNPYNIVDSTPYGKDVVAGLAKACARYGIKFCLYYSQSLDWHAPGGGGHWEEDGENDWGNTAVAPEAFAKYLKEKVKPQLRELLTQYGPVGIIWFDTPVIINKQQSTDLREFVHSLQPDCLVSGRVGNDVGDYSCLGDNQIPPCPMNGDWECPITLNDTWGYKKNDHNWKSTEQLLFRLCDLAAKGVNCLLNIGPDARGVVPPSSVSRLLKIGEWMKINGEAIYGSSASPFPYDFAWGNMTRKGNKLYLLIMKWNSVIRIYGLRNKIRHAKFLADPQRNIGIIQEYDSETDMNILTLKLGRKRPERYVSVLELELIGEPTADTTLRQEPDGTVRLLPDMAELHSSPANPGFSLNKARLLQNWNETESWLGWEFKLVNPGKYDAMVILLGPNGDDFGKPGKAGQKVVLNINGKILKGTLLPNEKIKSFRTEHHPEYGFRMGQIKLDKPGSIRVKLKAEKIPEDAWYGLPLASVRLLPVNTKTKNPGVRSGKLKDLSPASTPLLSVMAKGRTKKPTVRQETL